MYAHGLFLFFRIENRRAFGRWLDAQAGSITTAVPWGKPDPASTLNVALSLEGLKALGAPARGTRQLSQGVPRWAWEERAPLLGDTGHERPQDWDERLRGLHGVVTVMAQERGVRDERRAELEAEAGDAGLEIQALAQETDVLDGEREPFGFADGISQPAIRDPEGRPMASHGWTCPWRGGVRAGLRGRGWRGPRGAGGIGFNGSYMVVRKLEQDVEGFWDFLRERGRGRRGDDMDWLAAKIVGRWRDGTPLVALARGPRWGRRRTCDALNDFTYGADREGFRCPIGAHIRSANPRDSLDREWRFTNRHRIIRRGMPYAGRRSREAGADLRLLKASIERQFEFVQSQWMGDGNAFGLARSRLHRRTVGGEDDDPGTAAAVRTDAEVRDHPRGRVLLRAGISAPGASRSWPGGEDPRDPDRQLGRQGSAAERKGPWNAARRPDPHGSQLDRPDADLRLADRTSRGADRGRHGRERPSERAGLPAALAPRIRRGVRESVEPGDEIGPQLTALGSSAEDVRWVVLTHLHNDYTGGLAHFPHSEILVCRVEFDNAKGSPARCAASCRSTGRSGSRRSLRLRRAALRSLLQSRPLTEAGDVTIVATHGHSKGHVSVVVEEDEHAVFLAGDTSYTQALMIDGAVDGGPRRTQGERVTRADP